VSSVRTIAYWTVTVLIAGEMVGGGIWDLLRIEYVRVVLEHLGYPLYLLFILGVWKIPGGVVMLAPRFQLLKEWAYAGAVFNYTGAAASHLAVGDGFDRWGGPLLFAGFAVASWALRPPARRLAPAGSAVVTRSIEWFVTLFIVIAIVGMTLVTLPEGPPPGYR
jgi:hypothetical protein